MYDEDDLPSHRPEQIVTSPTSGMKFVPLHEDHSIQSVTFAIVLSAPLGKEDLETIRQSHAEWSDELPAVMPAPSGFEFDGAGFREVLTGVQFGYLRPDGSPAWQLLVAQNQIAVECARYTRWDRVWAAAESHLGKALKVVASTKTSFMVSGLNFHVVDEYRTARKDYALEHLIVKGSEYLVPHVFKSGPVWHSHHGWFEHTPEKFLLNRLNIDSRRMQNITNVSDDPDDVHSVSISHVQQLRYHAAISFDDAKAKLTSEMSYLHSNNKRLLDQLLVEPIKKRISLGVS